MNKYTKFVHNFDSFVIWDDEERGEYYYSRGGAVGFFFSFAARQKYMLGVNEVFGPMPLPHVNKKTKHEGNELKARETREDLGLDAEMSFYVFEKAGLI